MLQCCGVALTPNYQMTYSANTQPFILGRNAVLAGLVTAGAVVAEEGSDSEEVMSTNKEKVLEWLNSSEAKTAKLEQEAKVHIPVTTSLPKLFSRI